MLDVSDGESIYIKKWIPDKLSKKRVIIQLAHGMSEHIGRYDDFARALAGEGYIVVGNDHRGHGRTAKTEEDLGYFANNDGWDRVVKDLNEITKMIRSEYQDAEIILLGHSMGSFLARRYVQRFPHDIDGLILSGTGYSKGLMGRIGVKFALWERRRKGAKTKSVFLDKLIFGSFNDKFLPSITPFDWLSRDEKIVKNFIEDDLCGFVFTWGGFYDLLKGIETIHKRHELRKTPKDLPMYIFSGGDDPVGLFGKGVEKVYEAYRNIGMKDVKYKLYPGGRHEMLNEINKEEVYEDVIAWIEEMSSSIS